MVRRTAIGALAVVAYLLAAVLVVGDRPYLIGVLTSAAALAVLACSDDRREPIREDHAAIADRLRGNADAFAYAVETLAARESPDEPEPSLQGVPAGGEAVADQLGRYDAGPGGVPGVERLGHGAEVLAQSRRL